MTDLGGKVAIVAGPSVVQRVAFRTASRGAALMLFARAEVALTIIAGGIVVASESSPLTEVA